MKVVCDNCRAVYKVPDAKLVKAVNKATCRNCGHRMLIPRPKPGADPDQRQLVTAVPPTPVGAPQRDLSRTPEAATGGVRNPPRPAHAGRSLPPSALNWEEAPDTAVLDGERNRQGVMSQAPRSVPPAPGNPTGRQAIPSGNRSLPPAPPRAPASHAPRSAPVSARSIPPTPSVLPPGPHSASGRRPIVSGDYAAAFDPAADLNWAILGTMLSLLGAFSLAMLSVFNVLPLMWFGLAVSFGGVVLTLGVLLTGNRGRRPARAVLSAVLGFMVAIVMASTMVATKWGAERMISELDIEFSPASLSRAIALPAPFTAEARSEEPALVASAERTPTPNEGTEQGEGAAPAADAQGDGGEAEEQAGGASVAARAVPPQPNPRTADPAPQSKGNPSPAPTVEPKPRSEPRLSREEIERRALQMSQEQEQSAAAPDDAPPGVPIEAVHVMLTNNLSVKRCFVPLFRAKALPPRVEVKFNIAPSGTANDVQILAPAQYSNGSELEQCVAQAISSIQFPPTTGKGTSIQYPFILQ